METAQEKDRVSLFKAAVDKMIATSEDSYKGSKYSSGKLTAGLIKEYTDEEVENIISSGDVDSMRELSRSYFYASGFYRRIIFYYAYLLTYSHLIIPHFKKKVNNTTKNNYYQALSLCEDLDIKSFCQHAAVRVLVDGSYFGAVIQQGDQLSIMDLPPSYCRTRFKGFSGLDIVEFDVRYFSTITDKDMKEQALKVYPKEVKRTYNNYVSGKGTQWCALDEGVGVHFHIEEARPLFINTIKAVNNFETYRDLEITKEEQELKKILVQHLGTKNDGEFIVEPEEAEELHRGACRMLANNTTLDVLTTYAEVTVESLSDARQTVNSNLETFQDLIYSESGASQNVFAADGNISLEKSLQNDLSLMMNLAEQLSDLFTYILNTEVGNKGITYSFVILPISFYNTKEYIEQTYKLATAGYSFLLPAIACGLSQKQIVDLKTLENDVLALKDVFIPLSTSYTESADDTGGNPGLDDSQKSDKTITNQNGGEE